ncbi:MAG: FlgD immunoglobulin-like domain containing protein, partial [bacterium]
PRLTLQAGSYGEYVQVDYTPANDGSHDAVTAEVVNYHGERFQDGRLRFLLSNQPGTVQVTGGDLLQTDRSGEFLVCYVKVDIGASSSQTVSVALDTLSSASGNTPSVLTLGPNRPNPFNPSSELFFSLPADGPMRLAIYDQRGFEVAVLVDGFRTAGDHQVTWHGRNDHGQEMPSGIYLARISAGREVRTRKLVLAR